MNPSPPPAPLAIRPWLGLAAGVVSGLAGHLVFIWLIRQGFYALVLPGAAVGIGYNYVVRRRLWPFSIACGLLGLLAGLLSEWRAAPFVADPGLGYFLAHLHQLRPLTLIMIGLGAAIAFWLAYGRRQYVTEWHHEDKKAE